MTKSGTPQLAAPITAQMQPALCRCPVRSAPGSEQKQAGPGESEKHVPGAGQSQGGHKQAVRAPRQNSGQIRCRQLGVGFSADAWSVPCMGAATTGVTAFRRS